MSFSFSTEEIVNKIYLSFIQKRDQNIDIKITNKDNGDIIYDGKLKEIVFLRRPAYLKNVVFTITASPIGVNQLDIKEVAFFQVEYTSSLQVDTVSLPSFSNKYLTFEGVDLETKEDSFLFDFSVKINGNPLSSFSSENQISGPYKDPTFNFACKLNNVVMAGQYLRDPVYSVFSGITPPSDSKYFKKLTGAERNIVTQERSASNTVFFELPIEGLESLIDVTLNGFPCTRALKNQELLGRGYYIEYTGIGYAVTFAALQSQDSIGLQLTGLPNYIDGNKIIFPDIGLAQRATLKYATNLSSKRMTLFPVDGATATGERDVQEVKFLDAAGNTATYTEKALGATLSENEYAIDYKNGYIYTGSGISGDIEVVSFITNETTQTVSNTERYIKIQNDIKTFDYDGPLAQLLLANSKINDSGIFNFQKRNRLMFYAAERKVIRLPSSMSLHKGSVSLYNSTFTKREIPFKDGDTEIKQKQIEYEFYDYQKTEHFYHIYTLRNPNPNITAETSTLIFEDSFLRRRRENITALVDALVEYGDYCLSEDKNRVFVKNLGYPNIPAMSLKVKIEKDISDEVFSVDYVNSVIYTKRIADFGGLIKFKYSAVSLVDFIGVKEIERKESLSPGEYIAYISNVEEINSIVKYFTPVIQGLRIGVIG
jgi:hypothetical protein